MDYKIIIWEILYFSYERKNEKKSESERLVKREII